MPACTKCGTENPDVARFCLACGTAFEPPRGLCSSCGTQNPEIARFCLTCGTTLDGSGPVLQADEERRAVTAVFVDIVGSTSRAEQLDPEDVLGLLEPYYARLRAVLEKHGGTVEKFIGDAVVALFGAPVAHEDDPQRAVRAGLGILTAMADLNEEDPSRGLHVRVGITTGEAIVALDAKVDEGRGMAWGDVLNTAARLQSAAPVNGVLVDERTYLAAVKRFEFRQHEPVHAKGKAEPVPVWVAVAEVGSAIRPRGPLVGRRAELDRLISTWELVRAAGKPALAMVVGEPGLGKSRLLSEVCDRADGARVHWGRCLSYGEGITYWPVSEIVSDAAGILVSDTGDVVAQKLGALLESLPTDDADQLRTTASALSNLLGAPTTPHGTYTTQEISRAELHWGIRRAFELLAASRPLVLVFEDLHWAEPTLLKLIGTLLDADAPVLLLGSARPELAEREPELLEEDERTAVVELAELSAADGAALVGELLETTALERGTLERLVANAGGNPLFIEETVRILRDAPPDIDLESLRVPHSLQALVGARLDALPPSEKRLAQRSSVAGAVFWTGAAAVLDDWQPEPDPILEALVRRDVLLEHESTTVEDEREWEFKHAVIREVAYGRLPKGRRVALHVRFADWMRGLQAGGDEFVEIVAHHLEQACLVARGVSRLEAPPPFELAVSSLARAAEKAERREGSREAERFYTRALALLPDEVEEQRLELRLRRARMTVSLGELHRAEAELEEIAGLAQAVERADIRCEARIWLGNIAGKHGHAADVRRHLDEAEALAATLDDRRLVVRTGYEAAQWESWFGSNVDRPIAKLEAALAVAAEDDELALQIEGNMRLGVLLFNAARLSSARKPFERCLALASETGSVRYAARATYALGVLAHYAGNFVEAERLGLQAREWLDRTDDAFFRIQNLRALGANAIVLREIAAAEDYVRSAFPLALDFGGYWVAQICCTLAEALILQARAAEAREAYEIAAAAVSAEDALATATLLWTEATVEVGEGNFERALELYADAVRLFEENETWLDVAEIRRARADALRRSGRTGEARAELEHARETFLRLDASGPLTLVEVQLAELATIAAIGSD